MQAEIVLLLLAVSVAAVSARAGRSGYDCRKYCGYQKSFVCSKEGTTYDNECMMKCDWAYKDCSGQCPCYRPPPRPVFYEPRPVEYNEPRVVYYEPQGDCTCSPEKDYVCANNGESYENECKANCDGQWKVCDGQCPCT